MSLDPRFVILMTSCLRDQCVSDHRQECLFEDLLEDFDDGSLCALSLRSDRNYDALSAIPTKEEIAALQTDKGKLPKSLQFVSPQRFVTSALVQALGEIDRLLPGTELEIHTSTSKQALSLKPSLKSVRVLTLPHMESSAMFTEEHLARLFRCCKDILMRLSFYGIQMIMIMFSLLPFLNLFLV